MFFPLSIYRDGTSKKSLYGRLLGVKSQNFQCVCVLYRKLKCPPKSKNNTYKPKQKVTSLQITKHVQKENAPNHEMST